MASKLETFLNDQKIDHRRVLTASRQAERLRPEDRAIRLKLKQARLKEDAKRPEGLAKPRTGRPVTKVALAKAMAGEKISGAAKTRILRAVNRVLEQRKKDAVTLDALFDAGAPKAAAEG